MSGPVAASANAVSLRLARSTPVAVNGSGAWSSADGATADAARIADTQNTATLVNLPLNTRMLAGESNVMLSNYFDYAGAAASIAPLTDAANVHVSHVILATDKLMEQLKDLKGPLVLALLSSSTNDLATMASDYRTSEMIGLADYLRGVGFENIKTIDAPYAEETFEDGTVVAAIDRQQLCRDLGIFVSPVAEEAPAEE